MRQRDVDARQTIVASPSLVVQTAPPERALEEERRLRVAAEERARAAEHHAARAMRLQQATAALSEARGRAEAGRAALEHAMKSLGAVEAHLCLHLEGEGEAEIVCALGVPAHLVDRHRRILLDEALPIAAALRTGHAVHCTTTADRAARFPELKSHAMALGSERFSVVPLILQNRPAAAICLGFSADRDLDLDEQDHLAVLARCCARALERAALYDAARRACEEADTARRRLALLADASALLSSSLDEEATLENAARTAVPELADWCVAALWPEEADQPPHVAVVHASAAKQRQLRAVVQEDRAWLPRFFGLEEATRDPAARLREDCAELLLGAGAEPHRARVLRDVGLVSAIVAPLAMKGGGRGALLLASGRPGHAFHAGELVVAAELARRAAQALENARLHREVEASIGAREELLAMVSHDLKNPLTTILVGASVLVDGGEADAQEGDAARGDRRARTRKIAATIQRSAQKMTQLVRDLLDLARLRQGRVPLDVQPWCAAELLEQAFDFLRPVAAEKGQELLAVDTDQGLMVRCDKERVIQVLSNLVGNAVKFSPEGSTILVDAVQVGATVRFAVRDTGRGMTSEELDHVFERYWQANKDARGTGLGLCIAKGLIEAHGGRIWIESEAGRGTAIFFTLPMVDRRGRDRALPPAS